MRLPYGRRLACYWLAPGMRSRVTRMGSVWLVRIGRLQVVFYSTRVSWSDLDRKVEASYQRKRGAK